jgi:hypothetical protein
LRRKVDCLETDSGIDRSDLDILSVVECLSYDIEAVSEDIMKIVETDELRRCDNAEAVRDDITVLFED